MQMPKTKLCSGRPGSVCPAEERFAPRAYNGGKVGGVRRILIALLAVSSPLWGQEAIPAGTVLPVQLTSTVDSRKCRPGQAVSARVKQDVPLPGRGKIPARAKVTGHIVDIASTPQGGARLTLQFDTLTYRKRSFTIVTNLRAMAAMMDVQAAQIPTTGVGVGDVSYWMDTNQVGGDAVYGEGGPVTRGSEVVGVAVPGGVLVQLNALRGKPCRAAFAGNDRPQALWVFSSDACGLYGFSDLDLAHAGRTDPQGQIVFQSTRGPLHIAAGSGLLLRVNASDADRTQ